MALRAFYFLKTGIPSQNSSRTDIFLYQTAAKDWKKKSDSPLNSTLRSVSFPGNVTVLGEIERNNSGNFF